MRTENIPKSPKNILKEIIFLGRRKTARGNYLRTENIPNSPKNILKRNIFSWEGVRGKQLLEN